MYNKTCPTCKTDFIARHGLTKYCTEQCAKTGQIANMRKWNAARPGYRPPNYRPKDRLPKPPRPAVSCQNPECNNTFRPRANTNRFCCIECGTIAINAEKTKARREKMAASAEYREKILAKRRDRARARRQLDQEWAALEQKRDNIRKAKIQSTEEHKMKSKIYNRKRSAIIEAVKELGLFNDGEIQ